MGRYRRRRAGGGRSSPATGRTRSRLGLRNAACQCVCFLLNPCQLLMLELLQPSASSSGTSLFRSSGSDVALSMAQRLGRLALCPCYSPPTDLPRSPVTLHRIFSAHAAKRFKKQIFLSVDVPPSMLGGGGGPRVLLAAERALVRRLQELEAGSD
jgi:hypothetical protein